MNTKLASTIIDDLTQNEKYQLSKLTVNFKA